MKRYIITIVLMLFFGVFTIQAQNYTRVDNTTFQSTKTKSSSYKPTGKYFIDKDNIRYEIHVHKVSKGKDAGQTYCYIQKVSKKTGKSYWKKIDVKPEELSK